MTAASIRAVSYGGGVQSTALLVLAAQGRIDFPLFLMANVGDDSEHPDTLRYVREVAAPYADDHGIELVVLDRVKRDGTVETLWGRLMREGSRSLPIPVRMSNGAPGNRSCTADFKIRVIGKELRRRGATAETPATVGIGISLDEIQRANTRRVNDYERVVYPLVGIGEETGLKLRRDDCSRIIAEAGLPVPPKSSCFFCPFHRPTAWADLAREHPDLWQKSIELEETLNQRRDMLGKDHVYLTRFGVPLREAIDTEQPLLPLVGIDGECDSGWCFT
ncbi:phosphoadenosine phosphosulfate reductase [Nocardioides fonticola]|uniref:Phosphoadenosine phosphosulfate reductase n=1 Tax=Nocardioides fonticola TaxID=450363 RepID=A0ABP7XHR9_9ACTN